MKFKYKLKKHRSYIEFRYNRSTHITLGEF